MLFQSCTLFCFVKKLCRNKLKDDKHIFSSLAKGRCLTVDLFMILNITYNTSITFTVILLVYSVMHNIYLPLCSYTEYILRRLTFIVCLTSVCELNRQTLSPCVNKVLNVFLSQLLRAAPQQTWRREAASCKPALGSLRVNFKTKSIF